MATTLYERMGGYDAISASIDALMVRMENDGHLAKYFVGHGNDSKMRIRQLQVEMICQATGGPCFYLGRDIKIVHKGMGINGVDWQAMITHLIGVLDSFHLQDSEQKEVLKLLNSVKNDIVEMP
ncbi:MAG: group 1 truncated hemoglobin [Methanothrix sp.]|nr:MAG: group 1 truncated hemoglobin [Methanothrix sp.]